MNDIRKELVSIDLSAYDGPGISANTTGKVHLERCQNKCLRIK